VHGVMAQKARTREWGSIMGKALPEKGKGQKG
jgi:hypothetical protein